MKNLPLVYYNNFKKFYEEKPHLLKGHLKDFEKEVDKYFYQANEILSTVNNKYLSFIEKNKKFKYDDNFAYLERYGNLIIQYTFYLNNLSSLVFYEVDTESYYAYTLNTFKTVPGYYMFNANKSRAMSNLGSWNHFYSHYQRLMDKESLQILKELPKFKYLPIELFEKINYFLLLNSTQEAIDQYEIILKQGGIKAATGLLADRRMLERDFVRYLKKDLKKNISYDNLLSKFHVHSAIDKELKVKVIDKNIAKLIARGKGNEYKFKNYIFKFPDSLTEVETEGYKLKHCIYSNRRHYFANVLEGKGLILFVRKKDKPKEPYYTVEIRDDKVNQVRTYENGTNMSITDITNEFYSLYRQELNNVYTTL